MASADLDETYSSDGLIVAKAHAGLEPATIEFSKNQEPAQNMEISRLELPRTGLFRLNTEPYVSKRRQKP